MDDKEKVIFVLGNKIPFLFLLGSYISVNFLTKVFSAPGLWMQNFTTNEPDDSMIECAIRSLELVLPSEKGKDEW